MPLSAAIERFKVPRFVIFYASIVDGKMWCPDCRNVEDTVKGKFSETGPDGLIVYVGTRSEWTQEANWYRKEWKISNVPTIVKMENGAELARLDGDNTILAGLDAFVKS